MARKRSRQRRSSTSGRSRRLEQTTGSSAAELFFDLGQVCIDLPGAPPPADVPRGVPETRLSDSLLRLVEPYVPLPPTADEIAELRHALSFAALVWNATVSSVHADRCAAALDDIVRSGAAKEPTARDEIHSLVSELAARKRAMFPTDMRRVLSIDVLVEAGHVGIYASSAGHR